jgi:predicted DNA-binding protein
MLTRTQIRIDADTLARLHAVAEATSAPVAAVIRLCVDRHLPTIEAHVKSQLETK